MTEERWHKYTQWPLVIVATIFLIAYSIEVIADLTPSQAVGLDLVIWGTWALFIVDYLMCLILAPQRGRWFVRNLWQLVILVVPVLRPLRLLRLVVLLRIFNRTGGNALRGRIAIYVLGAGMLLVYVGALAVLDAEENDPGANIKTFGEALWWAVCTISTVGYGDFTPVTLIGRCVATGLMICGIAVLGVVTASVATWLIDQVRKNTVAEIQAEDEPMMKELLRLTQQVELLTRLVDERREDRATASEPMVGAQLSESRVGEG
jgi:voltage-gated potassium channel